MKNIFSRWLPAIARTDLRGYAQTKIQQADIGGNPRRAALTLAGLAVVGGLAAGPALASTETSTSPTVNPAAAAELRQQVLADKSEVKTLVPGQPGPSAPVADGTDPGQPGAGSAERPAGQPAGKLSGDHDRTRRDASPSLDELIPYGTDGQQVTTPLSDQQLDNAKAIVDSAKRTGVGARGAVIGVATSLQESKLNNYGHLGAFNDHDSLGLFQQRPSSGWGTPDQVTDPDYAATAFFDGLKRVDGWQRLPLTDAAQRVQVSAFPFAYAQWENQAAHIVQDVWDR